MFEGKVLHGMLQTYLGMGAGTGQDMARIITARRRAEVVVEAILDPG